MTLEFIRSNRIDFKALLTGLRSQQCFTESQYGMHIHVDRRAFRRNGRHSQTHAYRWIKFVYAMQSQVEIVARRSDSTWAQFEKLGSRELKRRSGEYEVSHDRRSAINCTKRFTYELRVGRSTLNYAKFRAMVEFADASVRWSGIPDIPVSQRFDWQAFLAWCGDQGDRYAHLVALWPAVAPAVGGVL